jgi:hypothetical protein
VANRPVFFDNTWVSTPFYTREDLRPGDTSPGPP